MTRYKGALLTTAYIIRLSHPTLGAICGLATPGTAAFDFLGVIGHPRELPAWCLSGEILVLNRERGAVCRHDQRVGNKVRSLDEKDR